MKGIEILGRAAREGLLEQRSCSNNALKTSRNGQNVVAVEAKWARRVVDEVKEITRTGEKPVGDCKNSSFYSEATEGIWAKLGSYSSVGNLEESKCRDAI